MDILLICPMRRSNLAELRLDEHLHRPDRKGMITHIYVAAADVKNSEPIEWPIPPETGRLIEIYLRLHRPHLAETGNPYRFPGRGQGQRAAHDMAVALTKMVEYDLGVEFNMHIMRHFGVWNFLRRNPGQYGLVSRVLGDTVATVMASYAGLETEAAAALYHASLRADREETRLQAASAFNRGRGRPRTPRKGDA
jgi:integrase